MNKIKMYAFKQFIENKKNKTINLKKRHMWLNYSLIHSSVTLMAPEVDLATWIPLLYKLIIKNKINGKFKSRIFYFRRNSVSSIPALRKTSLYFFSKAFLLFSSSICSICSFLDSIFLPISIKCWSYSSSCFLCSSLFLNKPINLKKFDKKFEKKKITWVFLSAVQYFFAPHWVNSLISPWFVPAIFSSEYFLFFQCAPVEALFWLCYLFCLCHNTKKVIIKSNLIN